MNNPCGADPTPAHPQNYCQDDRTCCYHCEKIRECLPTWGGPLLVHYCSKHNLSRLCSAVAEKIREDGFLIKIFPPRKKGTFVGARVYQ